MARSSETFFGPDNRIVVAGQEIPDTDPIIVGREHLFGQKRKRTRGGQPKGGDQGGGQQPPAQPDAPVITKPAADEQVMSGNLTVEGTAPDGAIAIYDGDALLTTASSVDGVFSVEASFPSGSTHAVYATVTVDGTMSDPSETTHFTVGVPTDDAGDSGGQSAPDSDGGDDAGAELAGDTADTQDVDGSGAYG